jgi:uncharacterized C2H2 Zn-finger protein
MQRYTRSFLLDPRVGFFQVLRGGKSKQSIKHVNTTHTHTKGNNRAVHMTSKDTFKK